MGFIRTQSRGYWPAGGATPSTGKEDLSSRITSSVVETVSTRLEERIPGIVNNLVDQVIDKLELILKEDPDKPVVEEAVVVTAARKGDKLGSFVSESTKRTPKSKEKTKQEKTK